MIHTSLFESPSSHCNATSLVTTSLLVLLLLVVSLLAACVDSEDRLGAEGERCFQDTDCRVEFVCSLGQCALPANAQRSNSTGGSSGTSNTSTGGQTTDPGDDSCVFANDGVCDEPDFCDFGTDTTDCNPGPNSCAFAFDGVCDEPQFCAPGTDTEDCGMSSGGRYAYVLIEDLSFEQSGESPGADLDAVSVSTSSGEEQFATGVVDFALGGGSNLDVSQALGAPDSGCRATNFVSLGGLGSYLLVEFGFTFQSGDFVAIYELGPTVCPNQPQWIDEDYRVLVSISNDLNSFFEIGEGGVGVNSLVVP